MEKTEKEEIRARALKIVSIVEPGDSFVVEEGFDSIVENWDRAISQNEGRFSAGELTATFSGLIVPFLLALSNETVKAVVKDQAKKIIGKRIDDYIDNSKSIINENELKSEIESAIKKSEFNSAQKDVLTNGFDTLFRQIKNDG